MPQMSPTWWTTLMMSFIMMYMMMMIIMYFQSNYTKTNKNIYKMKKIKNIKWMW